MGTMTPQITSLTIVYSTVYSGADQRKHQSSASLAFVWGIHRAPVNSPHKWPVTRKMFPFDDVIMNAAYGWVTGWRHFKWKRFPRYWPFVRGIIVGFRSQKQVRRSFDVFFDLRLNKRLSRQSQPPLIWAAAHYNGAVMGQNVISVAYALSLWYNYRVRCLLHDSVPT